MISYYWLTYIYLYSQFESWLDFLSIKAKKITNIPVFIKLMKLLYSYMFSIYWDQFRPVQNSWTSWSSCSTTCGRGVQWGVEKLYKPFQ